MTRLTTRSHSGVTEYLSETAKIGIGKEVSTLDVSPEFDVYSGVEIIVSEDTTYFAGTDTGRILTINNPWGTQAQAQAILAALQEKGFQYQPYTASGAILNPAAELGDGITISDTYSGIYKMSRSYSPLMAADLEAPQEEEIEAGQGNHTAVLRAGERVQHPERRDCGKSV